MERISIQQTEADCLEKGSLKKRWIFWWIVNLFWIVLFAVGTAVVWLREVDGAGAIPNT